MEIIKDLDDSNEEKPKAENSIVIDGEEVVQYSDRHLVLLHMQARRDAVEEPMRRSAAKTTRLGRKIAQRTIRFRD